MITILKPDVATGHFESVICRVLCRIVIVVMRASWRYEVFIWVFSKVIFSLFDVWNLLGRKSSVSGLDTGTWQMDWDIFDSDWLTWNWTLLLKKSRTKASYEAAPTEDIRFTILLLAPLMINTCYHNTELRTEMMKLKTVLSDQNRVSKLPGSYLIFQFTFRSTRLIILEIASAENAYIVHF